MSNSGLVPIGINTQAKGYGMSIAGKLNKMRTRAYEKEEKEWTEYLETEELESAMREEDRKTLISYCRPMQLREYGAWLTGFMRAGGKPTHFYDKPTPPNWFTANEDFTILPLYGSRSINIIVPIGVNFLGGDTGHNQIYISTGDGSFLGQGFHDTRPNTRIMVPVYSDTEVMD